MTELTTKETIYAIVTSFSVLAVLVAILAFWATEQPTCWDLHATEQQAITNCEN